MKQVTPREVGQLKSILSARRNLKLKISQRQKEILIGTILGDAYISPLGKIQIEHSSKYKTYIEWKFYELKNLSYKKISYTERVNKQRNKKYSSYRFWLRQYFRPWREYFYQGKMKIFPEKLKLSPLSLAVWYMDDGCYSDERCTLSTESFNNTSLLIIKNKLKLLGIDTYIRSNGKLGINAKSQNHFFTLIKPHIHEDMLYKLS